MSRFIKKVTARKKRVMTIAGGRSRRQEAGAGGRGRDDGKG
jgi:hypothetical protein